MTNKVANKEEEKAPRCDNINCSGLLYKGETYEWGSKEYCSVKCLPIEARQVTNISPSPSDKTWENSIKQQIRDELSWNGFDEEVIEPIYQIVTSATIKAKEEVLREFPRYTDINVADHHFNRDWLKAHIKQHAKDLGINLEEPSKVCSCSCHIGQVGGGCGDCQKFHLEEPKS